MNEFGDSSVLPGDPEAVDQLATSLRRAAELLRSAADRVDRLGAPGSVWEGQVAEAFLDHLSELSRRVVVVEGELTSAAAQLTAWREDMLERRRQLAVLRDELVAASARDADGAGAAEQERLRGQVATLADEHEAAAATVAQTLRRAGETAGDPSGALDGTAWLMHAETLLHQLEGQIATWVEAQGPALGDAVHDISGSTALGATVGQAAGSFTPGLDVTLGAAVAAVAGTAPGSHRLVAAARRAQRPIPLADLQAASFDRTRRRG
jgi:uncharacterized protein YukE